MSGTYGKEANVAEAKEWITPTEAARRVVALGYAATMTRQRIYQLADSDPAWPAPRDSWRSVGNYKLLPWKDVETYFKSRDTRSGPKGWTRGDMDER